MANTKTNGKVNTKGNGHGTEAMLEATERIKELEAALKKSSLNNKYRRVDEADGEFNAEDFLFGDAKISPHAKEIVTSDLPIRMPPLLTNWETLISATKLDARRNEDGSVMRLSQKWIQTYLLYRKPVDRQARAEAVTMGQEQKEQDALSRSLKA